jgi:enoyl-[acyl-carrier protein] reductase / trans-2-enoyl-CoA reductase (NAD+)
MKGKTGENMIISPKMRGFISTSAHPDGCAKMVEKQIDFIKAHGQFKGPKNVLVIGASTGYGLASRIAATFGAGAKTVGVFFEKAAENNRTATAGWYNTAAFEKFAQANNLYAKSINGDAFSNEIKKATLDLIRKDLGPIDLVIYSLASPRRTHPVTGAVHSSVLKPIGNTFTNKTVDPLRGEVKQITLEPASAEEIADTVAVMGGEDWEMWIELLAKENLLAPGVITIAYDYVGPELTQQIYRKGTIGKAKEHLQETAIKLNSFLKKQNGHALLSVNKALVTQASAAIPVVPLYISLLYKAMKEKGTHEGCIEQISRLFKNEIYANNAVQNIKDCRVRMDNYEMQADIQQKIADLWPLVDTDNLNELTDIEGYRDEFHRLFGFNVENIDYERDVDPQVAIPSLESTTASA